MLGRESRSLLTPAVCFLLFCLDHAFTSHPLVLRLISERGGLSPSVHCSLQEWMFTQEITAGDQRGTRFSSLLTGASRAYTQGLVRLQIHFALSNSKSGSLSYPSCIDLRFLNNLSSSLYITCFARAELTTLAFVLLRSQFLVRELSERPSAHERCVNGVNFKSRH
jgi:hypothetical protein